MEIETITALSGSAIPAGMLQEFIEIRDVFEKHRLSAKDGGFVAVLPGGKGALREIEAFKELVSGG